MQMHLRNVFFLNTSHSFTDFCSVNVNFGNISNFSHITPPAFVLTHAGHQQMAHTHYLQQNRNEQTSTVYMAFYGSINGG